MTLTVFGTEGEGTNALKNGLNYNDGGNGMLLKSSSLMIGLMATLLIVWAYQNYKYYHQQHNPLITNVIKYQNDNRHNDRSWSHRGGNLHGLENLQSPRKKLERRKEKEKQTFKKERIA